MPEWLIVLALCLGAGLAMPVGAAIARVERIGPRWLEDEFRHSVIVFGGGALFGGRIVAAFCAMALLGPVALLGFLWLSAHPSAVAGVMLFAAGGILYLIFQDIAPQSRLERHWAPPLGAVAGFLVGLVGESIAVSG